VAVDTKKTEMPKGKESPTYTFVPVCKSDEIGEGEVRQLKARGKEIAVGRVEGGQVFAVQGRCPHLRARMGKGTLRGTVLVCPWHAAEFDVTDGCVAKWAQKPLGLKLFYDAFFPAALKGSLRVYETKEEEGEILVAVD
jgi:nitrite reductase (NADH) small subunit